MAYSRQNTQKKQPVAQGKGAPQQEFTYVNSPLDEVFDFVADTIEGGDTIHVSVKGNILILRKKEGLSYSMVLKQMEDSTLYGTITPEKARADGEWSAFAKRVPK